MLKKLISLFIPTIVLLSACGNTDDTKHPADDSTLSSQTSHAQDTSSQVDSTKEEEEVDEHVAKIDEETGLHVVDNPESILVYVNKQRMLPEGYEPPDLRVPEVAHRYEAGHMETHLRDEAATALEALFADASDASLEFMTISGYRSYDRQHTIYSNVINTYGQDYADQYSAFPGTSEHQTGLAIDIRYKDESKESKLEESFGDTEHGLWLADHAHKYGFIIRYLKGKEEITGYSYEPWHIRYVGKEVAEEIFSNDLSLEEYFGFDY